MTLENKKNPRRRTRWHGHFHDCLLTGINPQASACRIPIFLTATETRLIPKQE